MIQSAAYRNFPFISFGEESEGESDEERNIVIDDEEEAAEADDSDGEESEEGPAAGDNDIVEEEEDDEKVKAKKGDANAGKKKRKESGKSKKPKLEASKWTDTITHFAPIVRTVGEKKHHTESKKTTPLNEFKLFISDQLLKQWAHWTNMYGMMHDHELKQTNIHELNAFIAIHIYMGIDFLPRMHMYWSDEFNHPFISLLMTRDRFKILLSNLCVTDPAKCSDLDDPVAYTAGLVHHLNDAFLHHYIYTQPLTYDEQMAAYKGQADIKQYLPMKPHKWGYKIWCVGSGNYLVSFELYTGKTEEKTELGVIVDTIKRMMQPFKNKNHILYTDCFFTSPTLMRELAAMGIALCGSVQLNRSGMPPKSQLNDATFKNWIRGESLHLQSDNVALYCWKDQKVIKVLYNHISPTTALTSVKRWGAEREKIEVPCHQAIKDYFYNARSVDRIGQLRYSYPLGRKSKTSSMSLVMWLIDMCVVNAFSLWCSDNKGGTQLEFRIQLMHDLASAFHASQPAVNKTTEAVLGMPLASEHFSTIVETNTDCVVCSHQPNNRHRTTYFCAACNKHMHLGSCFQKHHSKPITP
jgi:hypothetical protein